MGPKLQRRIPLKPWAVAWLIIATFTTLLMIRYPGNFDPHAALSGGGLPADFSVYLNAWKRVSSGQSPYIPSEGSPYKYSPGVLALMKLLPANPGYAWFVYGALSVFSLAFALLIGSRYRSWREVLALLLGLALSWKGILETLDYGQLELLILGMAMGAAAALPRWPSMAGILLGTIPWFKLPWGFLVLPFFLYSLTQVSPQERKSHLSQLFSGCLLASFIWGAAVPSLLFGPERAMELSKAWLAVLHAQPPNLYFSDINQSLWISANRWLGVESGSVSILALGLAGTAAGLMMGRLICRPREPGEDIAKWAAPWFLLTQLLNPLSWRWGSVFAIGMPFADQRRKGPLRWVLLAILAVFWLGQQNPVLKLFGLNHWSVLHHYGWITGYWISLLALGL